jgi:hypothetical protein
MSPEPLPGHRDDPCDPMHFSYPEELQAEPDPPSSRPFVVSGVVLAVAIGLWLLAWW